MTISMNFVLVFDEREILFFLSAHYKNCMEAYSFTTSMIRSNSDVSDPIQPSVIIDNERDSYIELQLRFFVNDDLHIAICQTCQYVVDVGSIGQHVMRMHGQKVDLKQLSKDINHF
jgi:hypothetical protein